MQDQETNNSIEKHVEKVEEALTQSSLGSKIVDFLEFKIIDFTYGSGDNSTQITLELKYILLLVFVLLSTTYILRWVRHLVTKKMPSSDKEKFNTIFSFSKWVIYIIVTLIIFDSIGINVTAIFAASAALLIGVGLALQTLFQDIISGVFILIDQSVHVGDIIELDDKVGRVEEINLRTTRAVTIDNKVLIIPNHLYLTTSLYNWTQNGSITRASVEVGVAYGSDVQLVKKLLIEAALAQSEVLKEPEPAVIFMDFGDSSLNFKVVFTLNDSFRTEFLKSNIRFEIDRLFRAENVSIPFPQRDIHIIKNKQ